MPEPTLYERLGGVYAIAAVVDHFSDAIVQKHSIEKNNPYIKEWNAKKAGYRLPGLKFLRTLWVCAIAGGPFQYTGKPLGDAHFDFQLSSSEFDEVSKLLADSLDHFTVPKRAQAEDLAAV